MNAIAAVVPTAREIERALRLLENQRRASRAYYIRHKDDIKTKSLNYWEQHKEAINERRRERYAARAAQVPQNEQLQ
jgi:hypothetical protein